MPVWPDLGTVFQQLREMDVNEIRETAERPLRVVVLGPAAAQRSQLLAALMKGPGGPVPSWTGPQVLDWPARPEALSPVRDAELVLFLPTLAAATRDLEQELIERLRRRGVPVVALVARGTNTAWLGVPVTQVDFADPANVEEVVAAGVAAGVHSDHWAALGRHLPALRSHLATRLIAATAQNNAVYAASTGLAEIVPLLDIPFNMADILVLTKNQAVMAYKLVLLYGLPSDPQQALTELAGVVGGGFLWRQVARQLIGLVPIWGILPKVAVAYAGTYATGEAVRVWAASGRRLDARALDRVYRQAIGQGRELARGLLDKVPKPAWKPSLPSISLPWSRRSGD